MKATVYFQKKKGANSELRWLHDLAFLPHQQPNYDAWLARIQDGQAVKATFDTLTKEKSNPQLGYWYGVVLPFACKELRAAGHNELWESSIAGFKVGIETTPESCDTLFKSLYTAKKGLGVAFLKRKATQEEMGGLIDLAVEFLATKLGVSTPPPTGDWT